MFVHGPGKKVVKKMVVAKIIIRDTVSLKGFLRALKKSEVSKHLVKNTLVAYRNQAIHITLNVDAQAENTLALTFKRGVLRPWKNNLKKTTTVACKIPNTERWSHP